MMKVETKDELEKNLKNVLFQKNLFNLIPIFSLSRSR